MSVWFAIPSCRPEVEAEPVLAKWRERGYRIALLRQGEEVQADVAIPTDRYLGWAPSINILVRFILEHDPEAEWIVSGGDDTEPDPRHTAEEIAKECSLHFLKAAWPMCWRWAGGYETPEEAIAAGAYAEQKPQALWSSELARIYSTFGVMQPTGDLKLWPGSAIDKFAGSPWMGREFCKRMYGGNGPMFDGYHHMFSDEELQEVAVKLGVFWQRPDLIHKHMHWGRPGVSRAGIPDFLRNVNSPAHWNESKALFTARKAAGFPGHEPLGTA
jgi:hypothetical protein